MNNQAAIYTRVSSDLQAGEDSVSLTEQESACRAYCERRGLDVVKVYQDIQSGIDAKRPAFQAMLADARAGAVDVLVSWRQDRLMRGVHPAAAMSDVMDGYGVQVETVAERFDSQKFLLMVGIARMEVETLKERSRMGKLGAAKAGRVPLAQHSIPFGYVKAADGSLEIDLEGAALVRRIFEGYVTEGLTVKAIVADLECTTGKSWQATRVHRILGHPAYKGDFAFGRREYRKTESRRHITERPDSEQVSIPIPPIVDARLWERAQGRKGERRKLGRAGGVFFMLKGLARCAECGGPLRCYTMKSRNVRKKNASGWKTYRYEYNPARRFYFCKGKCLGYIRAESVEDAVWGEVAAMLTNPDTIIDGLAARQDTGADLEREQERAALDKLIAKLERQDERLLDLLIEDAITRSAYDRKRNEIGKRAEDARALLADLDAAAAAAFDAQDAAKAITEWAREYGERLDSLMDSERREILALSASSITLNAEWGVVVNLAVDRAAACLST